MRYVYLTVIILTSLFVGACQSTQKEQIESSQESISKEQESYESLPLFNLSAVDVYEHFDKSSSVSGTLEINNEKDLTTFVGEHKTFDLYAIDHQDNKIAQFFTKILNPNFAKEPQMMDEVLNGYKAIFSILEIPFDEEEFLQILETDVSKERENKIDSYYEDMHVFEYGSVWISIEGIYTSNNEPKPNYFEVRIFPENPMED